MMPSTWKSKVAASPVRMGLLLLALCLPASAIAQERCGDAPIKVTGASAQELRLTCSAAQAALQMLGRCGIGVRMQLSVHIMREVKHPLGRSVFGLFDIRQERILVTQFDNVGPLIEGTPYSELPADEFYGSLIVHEVVHGVLHQHYGRPPGSHAAYEYPAYALQLEYLPPGTREKFLQASTPAAPARAGPLLTDTMLMFDPYYFAARSYQHFKSAPDPCAHLRALLEGDANVVATAP